MLIPAVVALGVAAMTTPLVILLLRRLGLFDEPSSRSSHREPTPRGGGLAIAVASLVGLALASAPEGPLRVGLLVTGCVFGAIGLGDDLLHGLPRFGRLGLQLAASALVAPWLLWGTDGSWVWIAIAAVTAFVWLCGFVNAFNFMDGINGLAATQAVMAGLVWWAVGEAAGARALAGAGAVVAGAALGFLPYNVPRARTFMGDVGSYFVGGWLAASVVIGLRLGVPPEAVLAPVAVCLADTGTTLLRRIVRREPWFREPHRQHAYQRLVDAGLPHATVTGAVAVCLAAVGALGAVSLTESVPLRVAADIAIVAVVALYVSSPAWVARLRAAPGSGSAPRARRAGGGQPAAGERSPSR